MTEKKAWPLNHQRMNLEWFRIGLHADWLRDVMTALGNGIKDSIRRLDKAGASKDAEWMEAVAEEEGEVIERLLGGAFVICQVQITETWTRCQRVLERCKVKDWKPTKGEILRLGEQVQSCPGRSKVEALDAAANYFKHREQWKDAEWKGLGKLQQPTADAVQEIGARPRSSGNLRTIAEALGLEHHKTLNPLFEMLEDWGSRVIGQLEKYIEKIESGGKEQP